jgi:hypothetical protein
VIQRGSNCHSRAGGNPGNVPAEAGNQTPNDVIELSLDSGSRPLSLDVSCIAVARPRRWACHLATAGCWFRGVPEWYAAGADTRGRKEGRPYPWSQQVSHEIIQTRYAASSGMTGAANYDIVSKGRRDSCGARLIVVSEILEWSQSRQGVN